MFDSGPGHLGPDVENVVMHTINLKYIDPKFSKKFTLGFGDNSYTSNEEESKLLGFVESVAFKNLEPSEISTFFKYKNSTCLFYHLKILGETNLFIVETSDSSLLKNYLIAVSEEEENISSRDISILQKLFADSNIKNKISSSTTPKTPASSSTTSKTPASSSTTPKTPASSSKTPKTPASSSKTPKTPFAPSPFSQFYSPGLTAMGAYSPFKNKATINYVYNSTTGIDIDVIAQEVDHQYVIDNVEEDEDGERMDPIMLTEDLTSGDSVKLDCCDKIVLKDSLESWISSNNKCPLCREIFEMSGTGPQATGSMTVTVDPNITCDGHGPGSFVIDYSFPAGIRDGEPYPPDYRTAYLPNDEMGREMLQIYERLFVKGFLFDVAISAQNGTFGVKWNVHQKSRTDGGDTNHGWPDENALEKLKMECEDNLSKEECTI